MVTIPTIALPLSWGRKNVRAIGAYRAVSGSAQDACAVAIPARCHAVLGWLLVVVWFLAIAVVLMVVSGVLVVEQGGCNMTTRPRLKLGKHLIPGLAAVALFVVMAAAFLASEFLAPEGFGESLSHHLPRPDGWPRQW
jgi:cytochrome b subunit of formate dehydrogenase